jgi:mannose-6-phosphate isomerase-like protein (cupin superfamily)
MPGYTVRRLDEVKNIFEGNYPGEMRMITYEIDAEQVAFTYRRMPQHTGGKGSYGHRHKTQEELYFVMSGKLQFKLEDDVLELEAGTTVRVAPEVARSVWNDEPDDAELIIVSIKIPEPQADSVQVPDFWAAD